MKPKPLEALNHFTVPCSFTSHPRVRDSGRSRRYFELFAFLALRLGNYSTASQASQIAFRTKKKAAKIVLAAPRSSQKVSQEQKMLPKEYHKVVSLSTATGRGPKPRSTF